MIFWFILSLSIDLIRADQLLIRGEEFCLGNNGTSEYVRMFCDHINGSFIDRCCYSSESKELIAIDLTELNLEQVPSFNASIRLIDLRLNRHLHPNKDSDFIHLQVLDDLFLPEQYQCPGGEDVWALIERLNDSSGYHCHQQIDSCLHRSNSCPSNRSFCNSNGPDHILCLCRSGFYGYKCLRKGEFPFGRFLGATTVITLILSTIFYWTQRRHVRTS